MCIISTYFFIFHKLHISTVGFFYIQKEKLLQLITISYIYLHLSHNVAFFFPFREKRRFRPGIFPGRNSDFGVFYALHNSSARASIWALLSSLRADRILTEFSVKVRFLLPSSILVMILLATGAQVPFSIRPMVRFW